MTTVLETVNLSKEYRLGVLGHGALRKDLQSWWARVRRLPDPNAPLAMSPGRLGRRGDRIWALSAVSLEVRDGEVLGIIGLNGAGKSTLLKIISRVTAPTRGTVRIRGRVASLLEIGTGFHAELTGRENVFLNGAILGMTMSETKGKFDEIVAFSGVEEFIDTPVKRYSSGMYVRLAFAVAAHLDPDILVVDEVLAVGDANFQAKCLDKMDQVGREGRTVLFVSHRMGAITKLCTRAIRLDEGSIVDDGSPGLVTRRYVAAAVPLESLPHFRVVDDPNITFQVLEAWVADSHGNFISTTGLWDPLEIHVRLIARKYLSGSNCAISVSREGEDIYHSFDTDMSPEFVQGRPAGEYLAVIPLPPGILPVGRYTVSIGTGFGLFPGSEMGNVGDCQRHALGFSVIDTDGDITLKSYSRSSAVIARLRWHFRKVDGTAGGPC